MALVGSVTRTDTAEFYGMRKIKLAWTCTAGGAVSGFLLGVTRGMIRKMVTIPAGGGSAPSDNYDITLLDDEGADVLNGRGADRDTANIEQVCPGVTCTDGTSPTSVPVAVASDLQLVIASAGASKSGTIVLYIESNIAR